LAVVAAAAGAVVVAAAAEALLLLVGLRRRARRRPEAPGQPNRLLPAAPAPLAKGPDLRRDFFAGNLHFWLYYSQNICNVMQRSYPG